jgi:hypothetical protein
MTDIDQLVEQARTNLLTLIAGGQTSPDGLRAWAEAYAWITSPHQPHGGTTKVDVGK